MGKRLRFAWHLWWGAALHVALWPAVLSILDALVAPGSFEAGFGTATLSVGGVVLLTGLAAVGGAPWLAGGIAGGYALLSIVSGGTCTLLHAPTGDLGLSGPLGGMFAGLGYAAGVAIALLVLMLISIVDFWRRR